MDAPSPPISSTSSVELDGSTTGSDSGSVKDEKGRHGKTLKKKKKIKEKEKERKIKKGKEKEREKDSPPPKSKKKERRSSDAESKTEGLSLIEAASMSATATGRLGRILKKEVHLPVAMGHMEPREFNNHHEIGVKEVIVIDMLGEGSFCNVWRGKCRGKEVLVRILKLQQPHSISNKDLGEIREEVKRLSKMRNPNIVLFMGACLEQRYLTLVTEYMRSNLEIKLLRDRDRKDITPYQRLKMAKDAALGVQWLHRMNTPMVHMNLHLSNMLVGNDGTVKIADFGFLNMRRKCAGRRDLASFVYMAPEFLRDGTKSEKCDVYSFGCCLVEILTGEEVFKSLKREILLSNQPEVVLYDKIVIRGTRPKLSVDHVPLPLAVLIRRSWSPTPEERPDFDEIIDVLDEAIIDAVIDDPAGRALWRNNFTGSTQVTWEAFVQALCSMFMIPVQPDDDGKMDVHWRCLKALLVKGGPDDPDGRLMQGNGVVTLESFGSNLACFGPLISLTGVSYLTRIRTVVELECFHGYITPETAEERLTDQQLGTFLLRLSSHAGIFTMSVVTRKGVEHKRILYKVTVDYGPIYLYNNIPYRSLSDLLKAEKATFPHPFSSSRYKKLLALEADARKAEYFIPSWNERS